MSKKVKKKEFRNDIDFNPDQVNNPGKKQEPVYEHFLYLLIISITFLFTYLYIFDSKLDLNGDNAYYYVLGKALSQGEGYVNIALISKAPNNHYPPGYPFILSLFMHISESVVFLKTINGIFLIASLFMFYALFNKLSGNPRISFLATFLVVLNAHFLQYGTMLMSEMSFVFFSFLCLIFILNTDFERDLFKKPGTYLILIFLVVTYYIRSTGLALFGGLILFLIIKKYWKAAIFYFLGFILLAAPWIIRGQKLGGSSYIKPLVMINPYRPELGNADLADYFTRFFSNFSRYLTREIPSGVFPFIQINYLNEIKISEWLAGLVILIFILYGLYRLGLKSLIIITYLITTFGILLFWPEVWTGVRFVLPVVPLLLFACVYGMYYGILMVLSSLKLKMKFNVLVLIILGLAFIDPIRILHAKSENDYPSAWKNYFIVADWFKSEGLTDVVVVCRKPMLFYLHSGTYTATYKYSVDEREVIDDLRRLQADYVVLDNLGYRQTYEYLYPAINKNQGFFRLVFKLENPDTYLLEFNADN